MTIAKVLTAYMFVVFCMGAQADLRAGVATVSITPLEENIPTPLGGYGDRNGEPATGIRDTLNAKCLVFDWNGAKSALVTVDACSVPLCVVEESLQKAGIEGLTVENVLMPASHSHTALEGFSMDRRNIAGNPHIGVFSEPVLNFVTDRIAQGLKKASSSLEPVVASSGSIDLPGMNRNRRGDSFTDPGLTVVRLDAGGKPLAVFVNFTAHGTFVGPEEMLVSAEWAGQMQRTVEELIPGVTCMYSNGAEGDQSPVEPKAENKYVQAENYGKKVGAAAAKLAETLKPAPVKQFEVAMQWVKLPPRKGAPDFVKIAGEEYHVTQEQLDQILPLMFPDQAPIYALRINDFELVSFPGEPICQLGLAVKDTMRQAGIAHPCVASNTGDGIGYMLTADEYAQSGYEVTASFYGDGLGQIMLDAATAIAKQVAQPAK